MVHFIPDLKDRVFVTLRTPEVINGEVFRMIDLKNKVHDIAVDFHDISYYGTRDTPCIRGIKPKNGTLGGYSFCTLDIIGNSKLTLDVIDINGLSKDYSTLMESLFERIEKMGVKVGTLYMDKEFFNRKVISKIVGLTQLNEKPIA